MSSTFPLMAYAETVAGMFKGRESGEFDRGQTVDFEFPSVGKAVAFVDLLRGIKPGGLFLSVDLSRAHHNAVPVVTFDQAVRVTVKINMERRFWTAEDILDAEMVAEHGPWEGDSRG